MEGTVSSPVTVFHAKFRLLQSTAYIARYQQIASSMLSIADIRLPLIHGAINI